MILVSFIPIIIYLVVLKLLDSFKLVKWKHIALYLVSGSACCAVALFAADMASDMEVPYCSPLVEEMLKAIAAILLMRAFRMVFFAEALCYGAAIGGGFAFVENFLYIFYNPQLLPATVFFRGMCTALLHIGCTALFLTLFLQRKHKADAKPEKDKRHVDKPVSGTMLALLPGLAIHMLYNMQSLPPLPLMIFVVLLFFFIFLVINTYNEKHVAAWLDNTMMSDVGLLTAIRNGTLSDTNSGRYLLSVKEQFEAEVFFDMICYIQLYLELTIAAKSRLMLREAGLAVSETAEEKEKRKEMIRELKILRSNIGIIGEVVLRPIVRLSIEDLKVMEN